MITTRMQSYDFAALAGEQANALLAPLATTLVWLVGVASVILPILALRWLMRRIGHFRRRPPAAPATRQWLLRYVQLTFGAAAFAFAASPTTPMIWQGFAILPAAALLLVLWAGAISRTRWRALVPSIAAVWLAGAVFVSLLAAAGAPMYRHGGRNAVTAVLGQDHPMLHQLAILTTTSVRVAEDGAFTPDVFLANPADGR